jgi:glycoprotein-N-acetylgalactosamine 3-beta-galactosyltransferase
MRFGKKLNESYESLNNTGAEDIDVGMALRQLGVFPYKSIDQSGRERFHAFSVDTHYLGLYGVGLHDYSSNKVQSGPNCCSDTSISFHRITPTQQYRLYALWTALKSNKQYSDEDFSNLLYNFVFEYKLVHHFHRYLI